MGLTFCCIGGEVLDDDAATLISFLLLQGLYFCLVPGGSSVLSSRGWAVESFLLVLQQVFSLCILLVSCG